VAPGVVEALEVVDIQNGQAQAGAAFVGLRAGAVQFLVEGLAVGEEIGRASCRERVS
jgi:hypothetical protein